MSFKNRLFLIIPFIIIFVILAPTLILYGNGYRYDWQNKRLSKTGSFFVDSVPRGASVLINGQDLIAPWLERLFVHKTILGLTKIQGTTPTLISNLIPNQYNLTVTKNGYHSWHKELEIKPEQTTNTGKLYLFLKEVQPELIISDKISFLEYNKENRQLIYIIYDNLNNVSEIKRGRLNDQGITVDAVVKINDKITSWNVISNDYLIARSQRTARSYLINLNSSSSPLILNTIINNPNKISLVNGIIYVQADNKIYILNYQNKSLSLFFDLTKIFSKTTLQDWLIKDNRLWLIHKNRNGLLLNKIKMESSLDLYSQNSVLTSLSLPQNSFRFHSVWPNSDLIVLMSGRSYFIVDTSRTSDSLVFQSLSQEQIIEPDGQNILSYNDFEVSLVNVQKNTEGHWDIQENLINRFDNKIYQTTWYSYNNYILTATNKNISVIELDNRNRRNIYSIIDVQMLKKLWADEKTSNVYWWGQFKNQNGLWRIKIQ